MYFLLFGLFLTSIIFVIPFFSKNYIYLNKELPLYGINPKTFVEPIELGGHYIQSDGYFYYCDYLYTKKCSRIEIEGPEKEIYKIYESGFAIGKNNVYRCDSNTCSIVEGIDCNSLNIRDCISKNKPILK